MVINPLQARFNKKIQQIFAVVSGALFAVCFMVSCKNKNNNANAHNFQYKQFKDSVINRNKTVMIDSSNVFDSREFTPGTDTLDILLTRLDTMWQHDALVAEQLDTLIKRLKQEEKITVEEKEILKENIKAIDSFFYYKEKTVSTGCRQKECILYADIIKSTQTLYLYIDAELKDSFKVSTGIKKHTTPNLNVRPSGPLFIKYTSRKFPGGNYKGLGNMPYAVFIRGGYAIHGTTPGNFSKLGSVASHGCIRLHPENARLFFELVKLFGLSNTWVTVRDSL